MTALDVRWGALRGSNPQPPVPQTSALPIELKAPYQECGGRVSRVLFVMIISLGLSTGRSSRIRLLSTSGLGEPPDIGRIGDCCGEDCPFHPSHTVARAIRNGLCCSHACACQSGLSTPKRLPGFHRAPSLCAARTFLWRAPAIILPVHTPGCQCTDGCPPTRRVSPGLVPKGRFELPRAMPTTP
jgi:hypothetical protein